MTDKKYLDKMEWEPNIIYYVKAISRNPQYKPRTWSHEGKYGEFWTTDVKVARYNTIDKKYTEVGLFQFMIPKSILNEVQHKVDVDMPFYLRKSAGFNKEGKHITKYNVYNTPEEIADKKEFITKTYDVEPSKKKEITSVDIPFDDDMGDDEVALKEDLKKIDIPTQIPDKVNIKFTQEIVQSIIADAILESKNEILVTLQNIEEDLRKIANCFKEMLDKFTVKIKKVKE